MAAKRISFLNTEIDNITMNEALDFINDMVVTKKKGYVVTPNVDFIVRIESDIYFSNIIKSADLIVTDGKPLLWISKKIGTPIIEKISGSDLAPKIFEMSANKGFSIYLLGGKEGVAELAKKNIESKYEGINIVGTYSPPYGFENSKYEIDKVNKLISQVKPDILFVCLGSPKQEKFIYENMNKYDAFVSIGAGATIDFEAGNVKRAPKWISNMGLEWLYRFLKEPKRLFKRYFVDDMKIFKIYRRYKG